MSYKDLVLDQDNNFCLTSFSILITCLLGNVWILLEEVTSSSILRVKGLISRQGSWSTPASPWEYFILVSYPDPSWPSSYSYTVGYGYEITFFLLENVKGQRWPVVETLETYIDGEGEVGAVILATI